MGQGERDGTCEVGLHMDVMRGVARRGNGGSRQCQGDSEVKGDGQGASGG